MRRSPPQGFARSSRFAGLSRAACAPLPRRPPCEGGSSFRNNSVPEDEPMRNFRSNPAQRRDHYQELTDKIIAALEAGTAPWRRPWDKAACGGATAPVNAATGHRYRGINLFVLGMSPLAFASDDPRWCAATARRPPAAGRSARARRRRRSISTNRSRSRIRRATASARRGASRSCAHSRSFTLPRSTESQSLRLRWRRRPWPSESRRRDHRSRKRCPCPDRRGPGVLQPDFRHHPDPSGRSFSQPGTARINAFP